MDERVFDELVAATKEALAHHKGRKLDLRTTEVPEAAASNVFRKPADS